MRDDDIPEYVQDNVAHIGIVGENVLLEKGLNVELVKNWVLENAHCHWEFRKGRIKSINDLESKTIATSIQIF
ncbi:MAG: hypothetical protein IPO41_13025 [Acidobacteria bacterium]|nr:hypothetical protein [Acidobacteriota bacterium]